MKQVTECIVLNKTMYGERSAIINVYSRDRGAFAMMVKGIGSRKSNRSKILLSPLSVLEVSFTQKKDGGLAYVNEMRPKKVFQALGSDVIKSSILMFLAEVLSKCLIESGADEDKYNFIVKSMDALDLTKHPANFHIWFLLGLTSYLGFAPDVPKETNSGMLDLVEGGVSVSEPPHPYYSSQSNTNVISSFLGTEFDEVEDVKLSSENRKQLLNDVVRYYELHLQTINELRSLEVLETVFA